MNSLNVKHDEESSNQLAFHLSAYTDLQKIQRAKFQKHKNKLCKYNNFVNKSGSDSYDKNDMKEKVNVLVRLHETMQEKLKAASYSAPIESRLTLVPDKWSRMYCSEYFIKFK